MNRAELQKIIREEIVYRLRALKEETMGEAQKESHEISAAASSLLKAIKSFNEEGLPEVPADLASALSTAQSVLESMADNPGQYKGGIKAEDEDVLARQRAAQA